MSELASTLGRIAFIGGGNMAEAIAAGLIRTGLDPSRIRCADPAPQRRQHLQESLGVKVAADNAEAADGADVVVLAVKPQVMAAAASGLRGSLSASHALVISIAAGINQATLAGWLGNNVPIARVMPNTPALVGCGASAAHFNAACSDHHRRQTRAILGAVGSLSVVAEEELLDAVTAVSGSGPAYFFLLMELLEETGRELGLTAEVAAQLVQQTALGAARLAKESGERPAVLRDRVTSPGGTTEAALGVLEAAGVRDIFRRAVIRAKNRAAELSASYGGG